MIQVKGIFLTYVWKKNKYSVTMSEILQYFGGIK